jgi:hypothetical protein
VALTPAPPPRFDRSPHLVALIAETERLAALVASAPAEERREVAAASRPAAALASLRLDGAEVSTAPSPDTVAAARTVGGVAEADPARSGTWFDAMRLGDQHLDPDQTAQLQALEFGGVHDALASEDLVGTLLHDPEPALAELHRRLTLGLVAPERAGAPRRSEQAVHDAANGRILYFTVDPQAVPGDLAALAVWTSTTGVREHGLVAAGVLHLELLRIHPFDAANGRLARAAARLALRARGLDPDGLAAPEPALDEDRLGYHDEVARTLRRRDLTIWLERWGEAVTAGLRGSARELGLLGGEPDADQARFLAAWRDGFTVADHRAETSAAPAESRAQLERLLDVGAITRVPASRGLRFHVVPGA